MKHHSFAASEKQDVRVKFLEDFAHVTVDHVVLAAAPMLLGVVLRESGLVVAAMPEFQIHTAEHVPLGWPVLPQEMTQHSDVCMSKRQQNSEHLGLSFLVSSSSSVC